MITLIYGEPGVGKTAIILALLAGRPFVKHTKPFAHYIHDNTVILGDYHADTIFLGTDKLSMSVQPLVVKYIEENPNLNYIIEGDRLFNGKFIEAVNPEIIIVTATEEEILARRQHRGSDQNPEFLKAKKTKIKNITDKYAYWQLKNGNGTSIGSHVGAILGIIAGTNGGLTKIYPPEPLQTSLF